MSGSRRGWRQHEGFKRVIGRGLLCIGVWSLVGVQSATQASVAAAEPQQATAAEGVAKKKKKKKLEQPVPTTAGASSFDPLSFDPERDGPVQPFRLLRTSTQQSLHQAGDNVVVDLFYDDDSLTLRAAWHRLDSGATSPVTIKNYRHGRYRVSHRLARDFVAPGGDAPLVIEATNAKGQVRIDKVGLSWNSPGLNPFEIKGAQRVKGTETLGRVALVTAATAPSITRLLVEPEGKRWKVSLAWSADADVLYLWTLGCHQTLRIPLDAKTRRERAAEVILDMPSSRSGPVRMDWAAALDSAALDSTVSGGWVNAPLPEP